jgi:hypothetical protein
VKQTFYILFIALLLTACNQNSSTATENKIAGTLTATNLLDKPVVQLEVENDNILYSDSVVILGRTYYAYSLSNGIFIIKNKQNDTLLIEKDLSPNFEFKDFNGDGFQDIMFYIMSNTGGVWDLILYDSAKKTFRLVENFPDFPDPIKIENTIFYYSYHKSGCADLNWDSDLFYIKNFKTIRIGNISGEGCNNRDMKDGIYIKKIKGEKETLFQTLPISTIEKYKDYKWGFIEDYWTKKYIDFTK